MQYKFYDSYPLLPFRPAKHGEQRCYLERDGLRLAFQPAHERERVAVLQADEGDAGAALQLADAGFAVMLHRDTSHKLHREECLAGQATPQVQRLVLKFQRAPWKTSSFGRRLLEAKERVAEIPCDHVLVDMVAAGVIAEQGMPPSSTLARCEGTSRHDRCQRHQGWQHRCRAQSWPLGRFCGWVQLFAWPVACDALLSHVCFGPGRQEPLPHDLDRFAQ